MVLRGGGRVTLAVEKLVVGDVVDIKFGDRIPADIRILNSAGFKVVNQGLMYVSHTCYNTKSVSNQEITKPTAITIYTVLPYCVIIIFLHPHHAGGQQFFDG